MDQELNNDETASLEKIREKYPGIEYNLRVSTAGPKMEGGVLFNSLEFLFPEWQVEYIAVGIATGLVFNRDQVRRWTGSTKRRGKYIFAFLWSIPSCKPYIQAASNMKFKTLKDFQPGEHIISLAIKVGELTSGGTGGRVSSVARTPLVAVDS